MRVKRSQLTDHPANPRKLDDLAAKKLKANLSKVGLLEPPVWNKRTGRLVGGHQRLKILDSLHKGADYWLDVAAVDLSEADERTQLVALNSPGLQGMYDDDALAKLLAEPDLILADTGFDTLDLEILLEKDKTDGVFAPATPEAAALYEKVRELSAEVKEARKDAPKKTVEQIKESRRLGEEQLHRDDEDKTAMVMVLFADQSAKEAFMQRMGEEPHARYVAYERVACLLKAPAELPARQTAPTAP